MQLPIYVNGISQIALAIAFSVGLIVGTVATGLSVGLPVGLSLCTYNLYSYMRRIWYDTMKIFNWFKVKATQKLVDIRVWVELAFM